MELESTTSSRPPQCNAATREAPPSGRERRIADDRISVFLLWRRPVVLLTADCSLGEESSVERGRWNIGSCWGEGVSIDRDKGSSWDL